MNILTTIRNWGRQVMNKVQTATTAVHELKDVFEIAGVPAFSDFYHKGIFLWKALYRGYYKPWHWISAPTVGDAAAKRFLYRLNTPKSVTSEMAGLAWSEPCEIHVASEGWEETTDENGEIINPDPLRLYIEDVLRRNNFHVKLQEYIEQGLALGGGAVKVWHDGEDIRIGYAMADQVIPLAWDNTSVSEAVFISRSMRQNYAYTRLEWHRRDGDKYVITNELYRSDATMDANGERPDILGVHVPLSEMFPDIDEVTEVRTDGPLFTYWRTPIANNLDDNSPLGVSMYANALETLHAIDICYDSLVQEFRLGRKKIIVPSRFLRAVTDPDTGRVRRYFDPNDETFIGIGDDDGKTGITDVSVELRVEEHVEALNALLNLLCLQLGFSANSFSFDTGSGLKTATEVVSENSKTYKTVKTIQQQLTALIEGIVKNILDVSALYDVTWQGQSVAALVAGGYSVKIMFDDAVTQDRQTNLNEGVMLVGAGLLSKFTFLTDKKYGQGLTEQEATAELDRIRQENALTIDSSMNLFGSEGEG